MQNVRKYFQTSPISTFIYSLITFNVSQYSMLELIYILLYAYAKPKLELLPNNSNHLNSDIRSILMKFRNKVLINKSQKKNSYILQMSNTALNNYNSLII